MLGTADVLSVDVGLSLVGGPPRRGRVRGAADREECCCGDYGKLGGVHALVVASADVNSLLSGYQSDISEVDGRDAVGAHFADGRGAIALLGPLAVDGGDDRVGAARSGGVGGAGDGRGEAVSAEQLADALWGERPPASWNKVVAGCVMRLRRALGAASIETTPQGYRLAVTAEDIDAARFERSVGRGSGAVGVGRGGAGGVRARRGVWRCGAAGRWSTPRDGSRAGSRRSDSRGCDSTPRSYASTPAWVAAGTARCSPRRRRWWPRQPLRERRWALLATGAVPGGSPG